MAAHGRGGRNCPPDSAEDTGGTNRFPVAARVRSHRATWTSQGNHRRGVSLRTGKANDKAGALHERQHQLPAASGAHPGCGLAKRRGWSYPLAGGDGAHIAAAIARHGSTLRPARTNGELSRPSPTVGGRV